jgi:hypothetical protein
MPSDALKLLLADLEAEVVAEALDLYLRARPPRADHRFDYRYRAAQAVLGSLRHGQRDQRVPAVGDADDRPALDDARPEPQSRRAPLED